MVFFVDGGLPRVTWAIRWCKACFGLWMNGGCEGGPVFSVAVLLPQLLTSETVPANETNFLN